MEDGATVRGTAAGMITEKRTPAGLAERSLAVLFLLLYSEGALGLLFGGEDGEAAWLRFVWPPVYLLTILLILPRLRQTLQVAAANWLLIILVGLCAVSALWSIDPGISLRRGIAVAATTLFGLYLAVRYDSLGRLRLLAATFAILAVASAAFALLLPQYGIMTEVHVGAWRGVFQQKNYLGQMMVYGAAVFLVLALADPTCRRRSWAAFLFAVALVLLSTSMTSLIALTMLLGIAASVVLLFRSRVVAVLVIYASILGAAALTIALLSDPDAVFGLIGRDASLTGRTDIWEPVTALIRERLWLGYGYGAFWVDPDGPAWYIRHALEWEVPSAHNGWVEVALDLGLVGVLLFVPVFAMTLRRALGRLRIGVGDAALWPVLFLALFLVFSLSESSILRQNNLVWVMFVATAAAFGYRLVERKAPATWYPGMGRAEAPEVWSAWRGR